MRPPHSQAQRKETTVAHASRRVASCRGVRPSRTHLLLSFPFLVVGDEGRREVGHAVPVRRGNRDRLAEPQPVGRQKTRANIESSVISSRFFFLRGRVHAFNRCLRSYVRTHIAVLTIKTCWLVAFGGRAYWASSESRPVVLATCFAMKNGRSRPLCSNCLGGGRESWCQVVSIHLVQNDEMASKLFGRGGGASQPPGRGQNCAKGKPSQVRRQIQEAQSIPVRIPHTATRFKSPSPPFAIPSD